jgi:uncharacterized membrane protein (UPF0127 family)
MIRKRAKGRESPLRVVNPTREQTLVTHGRVASTVWSRLRGLIGSSPLAPGEGLLIVPCKAIHTHFMRFPIDVLYVDAGKEVVRIGHALPPWRFGRLYRRSRFVLELPAGAAKNTDTQVGDRLQIKGCAVSGGSLASTK